MFLIRFERDQKRIDEMQAAVIQFNKEIDEAIIALRKRMKPMTEAQLLATPGMSFSDAQAKARLAELGELLQRAKSLRLASFGSGSECPGRRQNATCTA